MTGHALDQPTLTTVLDSWAGAEVAVRIVSEGDDLITVSIGRLGARETTKEPALFWPLVGQSHHEHDEQPGIWVHPERLEAARLHTGGFVVELYQCGVGLNLRRLH